MPSSRSAVAWGLQRFSAIPPAGAVSPTRKSKQEGYDMALAKLNRQTKEKLAAIEARCKERQLNNDKDSGQTNGPL